MVTVLFAGVLLLLWALRMPGWKAIRVARILLAVGLTLSSSATTA